jgi:hypothetical protein
MDRLGRVAQLIGVNLIPLAGVFRGQWSEATAIAFYWCETAIVVAFVALRLVIHRRATNKRGHYVESKTQINHGPVKVGVTTYNRAFLTTACGFGFGNLVFLAVLLGLFNSNVGGGDVDLDELQIGVAGAFAFIAFAFLLDLPNIKERPFAWVRLLAEGALWRVFVVYIAIFIGVFCATVLDLPHAMFSVFFGLRVFTDVASNFNQYDPADPPRFTKRFVKDWPAFVEEWRSERVTRLQQQAMDEGPFFGRPTPR